MSEQKTHEEMIPEDLNPFEIAQQQFDRAAREKVDLRTAAYMIAVERVALTKRARGVFP